MAIQVHQDAARTQRSIVPSLSVEAKLKAQPMLLLWRRLIDTAVAEAKMTRFGEPTDTAIVARWWISDPDGLADMGASFRATFERCCLLLSIDPSKERRTLTAQIDEAWDQALERYARLRLVKRTVAVLTTARTKTEMSRAYALLLVSQCEYEDTAGINRADPPARTTKHTKLRIDEPAPVAA